MKSTHHLKIVFLTIWSVLTIIGLFFGVRAYTKGDLERNLEIVDFHLCSSFSDSTTRVTTLSQEDIKKDSTQLFACGVIQSNKPESLRIYVYQEPGDKLVDQNNPGDTYPPGELFFTIDLNRVNTVGNYKVVVYFYRNIVGTTTFSITE